MAVVDDFVNPQLVFEDRASQFYRAWCVERSCKVILKVCRNERPDASETEMYRREFAFHSRMDHHGLMKALALQQTSMGLTLILEDRGGDILKRICEHLAPSHENLLGWFLEISRILAYCHSRGQFHGHLTPYCILIDTVTDRVQLAGFEYGLELITSPGLNDVELLLMTLAYSAPELRQVGDARKPDAKSDLYAMGAIMYEAFSGRLPFDVDTASDLLHSHAAVAPLPPSRYNPDIPSWLDEIIMTLLAKVPARRVSSAERLAELISEGMGTGRLLSTGVGEGQGFSEELCCREEDKAILSDWLREMDGRGRVPSIWPKGFLLTGDEGVGKTSLARWGLRHVAQHHPRVLSVTLKFDQDFRSHEDVFVQVVGQVVEMILGEPEEVLVSWRTTLNEVMKGSAAHLAAIVPEFGLLSSQPPVAQQVDTDGVSVTHQMMMDRFFSLFSRMGRPLLLFVDDVQWADEDSAQFFLFLQKLALEKIGLLFTLRSGVSVEGATEILVSYLKASEGRRVHHLSHFSVDDVATFLSSRLQEEVPRVAPLATLLYTRTGGNPFYLQSFFSRMIQEGRLFRAHGISGESWHWDMESLSQIPLCDSVALNVSRTLSDLSPSQKTLVEAAALLGHRVSTALLGLMLQKGTDELEEDINALCVQRVFDKGDDVLFFAHDLIQKAAYDRIPISRRESAHFNAGMQIYEGLGRCVDHHLFDIVHQFNSTDSVPMRESYRRELVLLNMKAGRRAMEISSFGRALVYFRHGLRFLGEDGWKSDYPLALELTTLAAEGAYATGDYQTLQTYIREIEEKARDVVDCIWAFRLQVKGAIAENNFEEGLRLGIEALKKMGFSFSSLPLKYSIVSSYLGVCFKLKKIEVYGHETLPEMENPKHLAVMELCFSVTMAAYLEGSALFFLLSLKSLAYTLKHGRSRHMPYLLAGYGFFRICLFRDYKRGYENAMQGLSMISDASGAGVQSRTLAMVSCLVRHWREPVHKLYDDYLKAYEKSRDEGEVEYAGGAISALFYTRFFGSDDLKSLTTDMKRYRKEMERLGLPFVQTVVNLQQLLFNLVKGGDAATLFVGPFFDESQQVTTGVSHEDRIFVLNYHITKATVCLLFGDDEAALDHALSYHTIIDRSASTFTIPVFKAIVAMVFVRNSGQGKSAHEKSLLRRARCIQKELKRLAEECPYNFSHLYEMVCGELKAATGSLQSAIHHFELASEEALKHNFPSHAAFAAEMAGRCYLKCGKKRLAHICFTDAVNLWRLWGAEGKARQVETDFHRLFLGTSLFREKKEEGELSQENEKLRQDRDLLDFQGISQALEALSSQKSYDDMLIKLLGIALTNGGAERGAVCRVDDDLVRMEACTVGDSHEVDVVGSRALDDSSTFPSFMIHYAARTGKTLVYNHGDDVLFHEPYFNSFASGSAVCIPSVVKSEIRGVFYLENRKIDHLFRGRRLRMLQTLSTQMGIAMDNTRLYESMREQAEKLKMVNRVLQNEIADRRAKEMNLKEKELELQESGEMLQEANITLKKMLSKSDENMSEIQENMLRNVEDLITPYMERLKATHLTQTQVNLMGMLEKNVEDILSPFARKLNAEFHRLTPAEIQTAQLVKSGKTTKEIAELLNLSPRTIDAYRDSIREKLGLKKSGINLRVYLMQL